MADLPFERKTTLTGHPNPKYVDLLDEDKPVAGQKFACLSFISPEDILERKELFFFQEFLKHWDFTKGVQKFTQFLNFLAYKYDIDFDKIMADFDEFMKSEGDSLATTTIPDDYKNFIDAKEDDLQKAFDSQNQFQTNTRGLKVRGCYPTQEEAELRCRMLREVDPHHNILVGPVGMWVPWDPEAYRTGRVEYLEEELNKLMHEKQKNEAKAKEAFEKRLLESKKTAIAENKKIARDSGNKLTQNIDKQGNLIGVGKMTSAETKLREKDQVSSADIRRELFESSDVRTKERDKALEQALQLEVTERKEAEDDGDKKDTACCSSNCKCDPCECDPCEC